MTSPQTVTRWGKKATGSGGEAEGSTVDSGLGVLEAAAPAVPESPDNVIKADVFLDQKDEVWAM